MLKKQHIESPELALSRRERQIMDILFRHRELSARGVLARLPDPPSYSAVRALLSKLLDKGRVRFRRDGRRYLYRPAEDADAARSSALRHLVRTFFGDSPARAANALLGLRDEPLSAAEARELKDLIDRLERESRND